MPTEPGLLRVLIAVARFHPYVGGLETHIYEVGRRLARSDIDVTILTTDLSGRLPKVEEWEGMHIRRVPAWPANRDYYFSPEIYGVIAGGKWDIVHCQGYHNLVPSLAMLAAWRANIPFVLSFHSGGDVTRLRKALRWLQWTMLRPLMLQAQKLIAVSEFEASFFREKLRLPDERIVIIPNGAAHLPEVPESGAAATIEVNDSPLIVSIGRLERYKGHQRMISALPKVLEQIPVTAADSVAQTASQCFDISVWQMLAILLVGGCVHIFPDRVTHNPAELLEQVDHHGITIFETVPSLLRATVELYEVNASNKPPLKELRWLIPTGEALTADLCRRWFHIYPDLPLLNAYGPTECSDDVTHQPIYNSPAVTEISMPIGRPLMNTQLYLLNPPLVPVPVKVKGELYVGGLRVGRGYLNDEQRTAQSFIADPFSTEPGARLYKTGDLARYLPDGTVEFLGRIDHQVKIRGYRIELGEIEMVLKSHSAVRDVVTVAREDGSGNQRLVAYLVLHKEQSVTVSDLQNHLVKQLPDYLIPSAMVLLEALPLNANGKIDRRALPAPELVRNETNENYAAPTLPVQQQLKQIWEELLDTRPIGIRDNFFELGGHLLLAARLMNRIEQVWDKKIPLDTLLADATIERLAYGIEQPEETAFVNRPRESSQAENTQSSKANRSIFGRVLG